MKIIYIHQYFHTPDVPGSIRSFEMARRFVEWGHEVDLITSDRTPAEGSSGWRKSNEAGIQVHWLPVPYSNNLSIAERVKAFFKFAYGAARKAASIKADVIFATSTPLTIALPAVWAAKRQGIPMVFEVRDLWPEVPIAMGVLKGRPAITGARWLEKFAYRNAAYVVALSPGMKDGVVRTGYPAERVHVIPNAADLELFDVPSSAGQAFRQRFAWLQDRPLVIYAGTLGQVNGVTYLAKLAAAVQQDAPDIRFLVVGRGQELQKIEALAAKLGVLNKNFFMHDKVAKNQLPEILSAADLATSLVVDIRELWDNSANKFFDGLAAGTAFAVNHGGWQAEMLEAHKAGIVLHPHDLEQAKATLITFLRDKQRVEEAGRAAKELAETRFARDLLSKQLEQVLVSAHAAAQK